MPDFLDRMYQEALDRFVEGDLEAASALLEKILTDEPFRAEALEALGRVRYRQGRIDEAIEAMERLAAMRPDDPMPHVNLSVFYMRKGMKEKAEEEKAKATVLNFGKPKP